MTAFQELLPEKLRLQTLCLNPILLQFTSRTLLHDLYK